MNHIEALQSTKNSDKKVWKLDPHSNPLSQSTMILAYHYNNRFYPIGTISFVGKFGFMISASHVFEEGLIKSQHNQDIKHLIASGKDVAKAKGDLGFSAIRFNTKNNSVDTVTLIALQYLTACIPGDIFYASPYITNEINPIKYLTLQPAIPSSGEKVYSCGYTNFDYDTKEGLCLETIKSGKFNWRDNLSFDFMVYEGEIQDIYINKFVDGYLDAPCFTTNYRIPSALSGGPTFNTKGNVCGINSATLGDQSLISLIYPTIFTKLRSSYKANALTINNISPVIQHMISGLISTDGSEEKIQYSLKKDHLSVYHKWEEYLNRNVYEDRHAQELDKKAKPNN